MSQADLFSDDEVVDLDFENPMVGAFGKGPEGKRCIDCTKFARGKCNLRGDLPDGQYHYGDWRACDMFETSDES